MLIQGWPIDLNPNAMADEGQACLFFLVDPKTLLFTTCKNVAEGNGFRLPRRDRGKDFVDGLVFIDLHQQANVLNDSGS